MPRPGATVRIQGLKSRPELNGQYSSIVSGVNDKGRIGIRDPLVPTSIMSATPTDHEKTQHLSVKPENLVILDFSVLIGAPLEEGDTVKNDFNRLESCLKSIFISHSTKTSSDDISYPKIYLSVSVPDDGNSALGTTTSSTASGGTGCSTTTYGGDDTMNGKTVITRLRKLIKEMTVFETQIPMKNTESNAEDGNAEDSLMETKDSSMEKNSETVKQIIGSIVFFYQGQNISNCNPTYTSHKPFSVFEHYKLILESDEYKKSDGCRSWVMLHAFDDLSGRLKFSKFSEMIKNEWEQKQQQIHLLQIIDGGILRTSDLIRISPEKVEGIEDLDVLVTQSADVNTLLTNEPALESRLWSNRTNYGVVSETIVKSDVKNDDATANSIECLSNLSLTLISSCLLQSFFSDVQKDLLTSKFAGESLVSYVENVIKNNGGIKSVSTASFPEMMHYIITKYHETGSYVDVSLKWLHFMRNTLPDESEPGVSAEAGVSAREAAARETASAVVANGSIPVIVDDNSIRDEKKTSCDLLDVKGLLMPPCARTAVAFDEPLLRKVGRYQELSTTLEAISKDMSPHVFAVFRETIELLLCKQYGKFFHYNAIGLFETPTTPHKPIHLDGLASSTSPNDISVSSTVGSSTTVGSPLLQTTSPPIGTSKTKFHILNEGSMGKENNSFAAGIVKDLIKDSAFVKDRDSFDPITIRDLYYTMDKTKKRVEIPLLTDNAREYVQKEFNHFEEAFLTSEAMGTGLSRIDIVEEVDKENLNKGNLNIDDGEAFCDIAGAKPTWKMKKRFSPDAIDEAEGYIKQLIEDKKNSTNPTADPVAMSLHVILPDLALRLARRFHIPLIEGAREKVSELYRSEQEDRQLLNLVRDIRTDPTSVHNRLKQRERMRLDSGNNGVMAMGGMQHGMMCMAGCACGR